MAEAEGLLFPDAPRVNLDRRLAELVQAANEVIATQGRLRALLRANQMIVAQLDLPGVLQKVVESAVELCGAQYGALAVLGEGGGFDQLVHVGMPRELVERIGHLPRGEGLLGALITDPRPIRLNDIESDPRSIGFPPGHPHMSSFLGVPIRVRGTVYGNLYLTNHPSGAFGEEDEQLVTALAVTAGFAVENACLYLETQHRQAWAAASAEITARLLAQDPNAVSVVAAQLVRLADADSAYVNLLGDDPGLITIAGVQGDTGDVREGTQLPLEGSLSQQVLDNGAPTLFKEEEVRLATRTARPVGPVMGLPLKGSSRALGVLLVARRSGRRPFVEADVELASDFAGRASVALELATARTNQERALLFEDRGRIARDLHDRVIQQLFGTGMQLQSVLGTLPPGRSVEQVDQAIATLDATIAQIRTIIFTLSSSRGDRARSVRHQVIDLVAELGDRLAISPTVTFSGPIDVLMGESLAEDLLAVISETVTNAVKHAGATDVSVRIAVADEKLTVDVGNDGQPFADSGRRSGLANLEARAADRGGSLSVSSLDGGTRVSWAVSLSADDQSVA